MTGLEALIDRLLLTMQSRRNHQAMIERDIKLQRELESLKNSTAKLCRELDRLPPPSEEPKASRHPVRRPAAL
jgi:hypothetical protein